jgi:hypothetical protein
MVMHAPLTMRNLKMCTADVSGDLICDGADKHGTRGYFVPFHSQRMKPTVEANPRTREEITGVEFHDR